MEVDEKMMKKIKNLIFRQSEKPKESRDQKPNYFDLAQTREDEEQAAYLAEWSRRHRKK